MSRGRSSRRRREREELANTPVLDRLLLPSNVVRSTLPDPGSLLDAIAERIQPTWATDVSVSGPLSDPKPSRAPKPSEYVKLSNPAINIASAPAAARECVARHQRAQVLHALKKTGAGGSRKLDHPRKPPSKTRC